MFGLATFMALLTVVCADGSSQTGHSSDERHPPSVVALATADRGEPELQRPSERPIRAADRTLRPNAWSTLYAGDALQLDEDDSVLLLCPDALCRRLTGSLVIAADLCESNPSTPCAAHQLESHVAKRDIEEALDVWIIRSTDLLLHANPRHGDEVWGTDPVLLSPRCAVGIDGSSCERWFASPTELTFLEIENADRYVFQLTGGSFSPYEWEAAQIRCSSHDAFAGHRVCTLPWPTTWELPSDGSPARLRLVVEKKDGWSATSSAQLLRRGAPSLDGRSAAELRILLDSFGTDGTSLQQARRRLALSRHGFVAELHHDLLSSTNLTPSAQVTLGLLWLQLGAPRPACHYLTSGLELQALDDGSRQLVEAGLEACLP